MLSPAPFPQEAEAFATYTAELSDYLLSLEQRLFSEGLHTLGHVPTAGETQQYLMAYFEDQLPTEVLKLKCVAFVHVCPFIQYTRRGCMCILFVQATS